MAKYVEERPFDIIVEGLFLVAKFFMIGCEVGFEPVIVDKMHEAAEGEIQGNGDDEGGKAC